ncbi:MAG: hypothetical protein V4539_08620 [Bacteroidota bacterium]
MKKTVGAFLIMVSLMACSDKYQSLYNAAPNPQLEFNTDTLKIREKDYFNINQTNNGFLSLKCIAPNHQLNIQITDTSNGKVHVVYRGDTIRTYQPLLVAGDSTNVFCSCDTAGIYQVDFLITDLLGKTNQQPLIIKCLGNTKPIAILDIQLIDSSQTGNWIYSLDASRSVKPDGLIRSYHYSVNSQSFTTSQPIIHYTFHAPAVYHISLFITDDLDKNSDTIKQTITIL